MRSMNLNRPHGAASRKTAATEREVRFAVVLGILVSGGCVYTGAQSILLATITQLARGVGSTPASTTWVLTGFILSGGVATPIVGRLGDMFGKRRALIAMLATVVLGLIICALARSLPVLIAGRVLVGLSSGVYPLGFGIIRDEFPRERVATAIGLMSISVGLGTAAGVLASGVIASNLSYHWLFWFPLMVAFPTFLAACAWIPESPVRTGGSIDWAGAVLLVIGLLALLLAISEASSWSWGSPRTLGLIVAGLMVLAIWIGFERRLREPLIDMQSMAHPSVWRANPASSLSGVAMFASFAFIPRFVEEPARTGYGFGTSAAGAALYLLPSTVMMMLCAGVAGRIDRRIGSRSGLAIGCLTGSSGFILIALAATHQWAVPIGMGMAGIGVGLAYAALPNLVIGAVPHEQTGAATAINTIVRSIGGAFGVQLCTTLIAQNVAGDHLPALGGYNASAWICAGALAAATAVALTIPRRGAMAPRAAIVASG